MREERVDELSFWDHVGVLRAYLLWGAGIFIVAWVAMLVIGQRFLMPYLLAPLNGEKLFFLSPLDPLSFQFKVAFLGAFVIAFPFWILLFSAFVAPALSRGKQIALVLFMSAAVLLGYAALYGTYSYLLPLTLTALQAFTVPNTELMITGQNYVNFVLLMLLMAFVVMELPVVISILSYLGIIDPRILIRQRRLLYLVLLGGLAFLTPTTDVMSLLIIAIPAIVLTEIGLGIGTVLYTRRNNQGYG